jgi:hypothetical protein
MPPVNGAAILVALTVVLTWSGVVSAEGPQTQGTPLGSARLQVFLDCRDCFADYLREELEFVDFVRDRTEADVHVLITRTGTGSGGGEYTAAFTGFRSLQGRDLSLKTVTGTGDTDDTIRRQLATTLRVGLLQYMVRDGVPQQLSVDVKVAQGAAQGASRHDPWNSWVFSIRGSASVNGEESNKERQISSRFSADRITPDWKLTFGVEIDQETEEFDLDEDEPVKVQRRERDFNGLVAKGLNDHWSAGALFEVESSTFDNIKVRISAAPAVEVNVFPYSAYTRRQLRTQYAVGVRRQAYHEETLFGKMEETLPAHELSVTYDQRERWGTVEGRVEWFQYLHDPSRSRLEANSELSWRIVRGLSVSAEARASRIRDQLSLRRRGATPEEILLRLRELQSGYEYEVGLSLTYSFGSIFSSIVNPRFGQ